MPCRPAPREGPPAGSRRQSPAAGAWSRRLPPAAVRLSAPGPALSQSDLSQALQKGKTASSAQAGKSKAQPKSSRTQVGQSGRRVGPELVRVLLCQLPERNLRVQEHDGMHKTWCCALCTKRLATARVPTVSNRGWLSFQFLQHNICEGVWQRNNTVLAPHCRSTPVVVQPVFAAGSPALRRHLQPPARPPTPPACFTVCRKGLSYRFADRGHTTQASGDPERNLLAGPVPNCHCLVAVREGKPGLHRVKLQRFDL